MASIETPRLLKPQNIGELGKRVRQVLSTLHCPPFRFLPEIESKFDVFDIHFAENLQKRKVKKREQAITIEKIFDGVMITTRFDPRDQENAKDKKKLKKHPTSTLRVRGFIGRDRISQNTQYPTLITDVQEGLVIPDNVAVTIKSNDRAKKRSGKISDLKDKLEGEHIFDGKYYPTVLNAITTLAEEELRLSAVLEPIKKRELYTVNYGRRNNRKVMHISVEEIMIGTKTLQFLELEGGTRRQVRLFVRDYGKDVGISKKDASGASSRRKINKALAA